MSYITMFILGFLFFPAIYWSSLVLSYMIGVSQPAIVICIVAGIISAFINFLVKNP